MSERGVFAVDRGIWDHDLLAGPEPFSRREAWLWLLSEAAWKPHRRRLVGRLLELERGQLAASLRFIASKWLWSEPRVRRFLAALISDQMVDARTDAGVTVITICKYDEYQRVSLPSDAMRKTDDDAGSTQERRKVEYKEYKEEPIHSSSSDSSCEERTSTEVARARSTPRASRLPHDWQLLEGDFAFAMTLLPHNRIAVEADKFRDHWHSANGPPSVKRDWSAAWRNWCRKAVEIGKSYGKSSENSLKGALAKIRDTAPGFGFGDGGGDEISEAPPRLLSNG